MNVKKSIIVEQFIIGDIGELGYHVLKAINTVDPPIGRVLDGVSVTDLIDEGVTVTILPRS